MLPDDSLYIIISMREILRCSARFSWCFLLGVGFIYIGYALPQKSRPNVVLVVSDDQGYGDIASHGNPVIRTPALDKLFGESIRLTQFHVDPTCSPTRAALLTGRYSARTGVWHTIMGRSLLRRDETTMADVFTANGYQTAIFGKWHLGDNYPFRPLDRGFKTSLVHGGGGIGQTPDYWGNDYFDDTYWQNGETRSFSGYCTDVFFDAALGFIEQNKNRPFFAYIPTNVPHGPYNVAKRYSDYYRKQGISDPLANFYGMITNLDENVARLVDRLDQLGLRENTILIFMTDNGTARGDFNVGMRGRKGSEYDGGHRVPFFLRWPAQLKGGQDIHQLTAHIDLLPTLIDLCRLERPRSVRFDGTSLVPLLNGEKTWAERILFVQSHRIDHPRPWRKSAVMTERYRLVNGKELYDIQADLAQINDLASGQRAVVATLRNAYESYYEDVSRRFGEYCRIILGSEKENPSLLTCHDWHGEQVPWNQRMVQEVLRANGFWAVEIEHSGRYKVTLRQRPSWQKFPIQATMARLKIGDLDQSKPIPERADSVSFEVTLRSGKTRLQTWFSDDEGSRGAFFVDVQFLH